MVLQNKNLRQKPNYLNLNQRDLNVFIQNFVTDFLMAINYLFHYYNSQKHEFLHQNFEKNFFKL